MSTERREPADPRIVAACEKVLLHAGVEPFNKERSLHWLMAPELIERFMGPDIENRMLGFPVHMEALLGEHSILLVETLGEASIEDSAGGGET